MLAFMYLTLGDVETGDGYLRRAEALAPERSYDDRADFCRSTGDLQCATESMKRYIEIREAAGLDQDVERLKAVMAFNQDDFPGVIEHLEAGLRRPDGTLNLELDGLSRMLAMAYREQGNVEESDRILEIVEKDIRSDVSNGLWPLFAAEGLAKIAIIRGDLDTALDHLNQLVDGGGELYSRELEYDRVFEPLRAHPEYPALLERLRLQEAEWLRQIQEGR
jgi:tetratricopeptide (TPR) repeat protein